MALSADAKLARQLYRDLLRMGRDFDAMPSVKLLLRAPSHSGAAEPGQSGATDSIRNAHPLIPAVHDFGDIQRMASSGHQYGWDAEEAGAAGARPGVDVVSLEHAGPVRFVLPRGRQVVQPGASVFDAVKRGFRSPLRAPETLASRLDEALAAVRIASRAVAEARSEGLISQSAPFPQDLPRLLKLRAELGEPVPAASDASLHGSGSGPPPTGRLIEVEHPVAGTLLLAHPRLADDRFAKSVILILDWHPKHGATGVTINPDALLTRLPPLATAGLPANEPTRAASEEAQTELTSVEDGADPLPITSVANSIFRLAKLRIDAFSQGKTIPAEQASEPASSGPPPAPRWAVPPNASLPSALPALFPPKLRAVIEGAVPTGQAAREAKQLVAALQAAQAAEDAALPTPASAEEPVEEQGIWTKLAGWLQSFAQVRVPEIDEPAPGSGRLEHQSDLAPPVPTAQLGTVSVAPGGPVPDFLLLHAATLEGATPLAELPRLPAPPPLREAGGALQSRLGALREAAKAMEQRAVGTSGGNLAAHSQQSAADPAAARGRRRRKPIYRARTRASAAASAKGDDASSAPEAPPMAADVGRGGEARSDVIRLSAGARPSTVVEVAERALLGGAGASALLGGDAIAYEGTCQWAPGQLDAEVASGSWIVVCADDAWTIAKQGAGMLLPAETSTLQTGLLRQGQSPSDGDSTSSAQYESLVYGQELWGALLASLGGEYSVIAREALRPQQAGHSAQKDGSSLIPLESDPGSSSHAQASAAAAVQLRRDDDRAGLVWSDTEDEVGDLLDDASTWRGTAYGQAAQESMDKVGIEEDESDRFADAHLHNMLSEADLDDDAGSGFPGGVVPYAADGTPRFSTGPPGMLPEDVQAIAQLLAEEALQERSDSDSDEEGTDGEESPHGHSPPSSFVAKSLQDHDEDSDSDIDSEEEMAQQIASQLEERIVAAAEARALADLSAEAGELFDQSSQGFGSRGTGSDTSGTGRHNFAEEEDDPQAALGVEGFGTAAGLLAAGKRSLLPRSALALRLSPSWYRRDLDESGMQVHTEQDRRRGSGQGAPHVGNDVFLNAGRRVPAGGTTATSAQLDALASAAVANATTSSGGVTGAGAMPPGALDVSLLEERYPRVMKRRRAQQRNASVIAALASSGLSPAAAEKIVNHFDDDTLGHLRTALQAADAGDQVGFEVEMMRAHHAISGAGKAAHGAANTGDAVDVTTAGAATHQESTYVMTPSGLQPLDSVQPPEPSPATPSDSAPSDDDPTSSRH